MTTRRRILWVIVALIVLFGAASARLFVWSPTDAPVRVDAVVALGGDPGQRRALYALELVKSGFAPVAVISLGGKRAVSCPAHPRTERVICFRANPLNTRGEAEYVARLARQKHWSKLIVVPGRSQTTRARMLFKRCTSAQLHMVPVSDPASHVALAVVYEWGALAKALVLQRSC